MILEKGIPKLGICTTCNTQLLKNNLPAWSIANDNYFGPEIPEVLCSLTLAELQLISIHRMVIQIKFNGYGDDVSQQQRSLASHVISFPNLTDQICSSLPLDVDDLVDCMKVVFVGKSRPTLDALRWVCEVDRHRVRQALLWLISHNKDYKHFNINDLPLDKLMEKQIPDSLYMSVTVTLEDTSSTEGLGGKDHTPDDPSSPDDRAPKHTMTSSVSIGPDAGHFNDAAQKVEGLKKAAMTTPFEDSKPINTWFNPSWWTRSYPFLYIFGVGGPENQEVFDEYGAVDEDLSTIRRTKLTLEEYFKRLANLRDQRFNHDRSFFGSAWDIMRRRQLYRAVRIQLKLPHHDHDLLVAINKITAADIKKHLGNFDPAKDDYNDLPDPIRQLLKYTRNVGANLSQSDQERLNWRYQIHAFMLQFGPFHGWITIVPPDTNSSIIFHLLGQEIELDDELPCLLNTEARRKLVAQHPSVVAEFFHVFIQTFIKTILAWDTETQDTRSLDDGKTIGGVIGPVDGFFGTYEEQKRRRLHLHLLVWLRGVPNIRLIEKKLRDDPVWRKKVFTFVESTMVQGFADEKDPPFAAAGGKDKIIQDDTVQHKKVWKDINDRSIQEGLTEGADPPCPVEGHRHARHISSKNWTKNAQWQALRALDRDALDHEDNKPKWEAFKKALLSDNYHMVSRTQPHYCSDSSGCFKYCGPTQTKVCRGGYGTNGQRQLVSSTFLNDDESTINYRRTHINVNNHNICIGACCRCNHDFKITLSGSHCRSLAWYITTYAAKTQLSTHSSYELIAATMGKLEIGQTLSSMPDETVEDTLRRTRKLAAKLMSSFQSRIELGMPLIMLHILGHPNHVSSHEFCKLNFYLFRKYVDRQHPCTTGGANIYNDDDDENKESGSNSDCYSVRFSAHGSNTIYCQLLDYFFRPSELCDLSPKELNQKWQRVVKKQGSSTDALKFHALHPGHNTHVMIQRTRKTIVNPGSLTIPRETSQPEVHARLAMTYLHPWPLPPTYDPNQHTCSPLQYMLQVVNREGFLDCLEFKTKDEMWSQAYKRHVVARYGVGSVDAQRILLNNEVLHEGLEMRQKERDNRHPTKRNGACDNDHQGHDHPDENQSDPTRLNLDEINQAAWHLFYTKQQAKHLRDNGLDTFIRKVRRQKLYRITKSQMVHLQKQTTEHSGWTPKQASASSGTDKSSINAFARTLRNQGDRERQRRFEDPNPTSPSPSSSPIDNHRCNIRQTKCPLWKALDIVQATIDGLSVRIPTRMIVEHFADTEYTNGLDSDQRLFYLIHSNTLIIELENYISGKTSPTKPLVPINRLNVLALGPSGCGKSSAISAFKKLATWCGVPHWIMLTAKTGKAAANIGGDTIDKLLGKGWTTGDDGASGKRDIKRIQQTFRHLRFLFTDEVSMLHYRDIGELSYFTGIGKCTVCTSSTKCADDKCKSEDQHFAGCVHTTWVGDFGQLPCVQGKPLYYPLSKKSTSEHAKIGSIIWDHLTDVVLLHGSHRYRKDPLWGAFMSDLHERTCTQSHADYLNERSLENLHLSPKELEILALEVQGSTSRHKAKHALNMCYSRVKALDQGHRRVAVLSQDKATGCKYIPLEARFEISTHFDAPAVENLPGVMILTPGMSGVYKHNLSTVFKIYNGAPCQVVDIILHPDEPLDWDTDPTLPPHVLLYMPLALVLEFPSCIRPKQSDTDVPTRVMVKPVTRTFSFKCESNINKGLTFKVTRKQFAFSPGSWNTDYAHQGATYNQFLVDLLPKDHRKIGLNLYVMTGRVTTHSGIYLLEKVQLDQLTEPLSEIYRKSMLHFQHLDRNTRSRWEPCFHKYFPGYTEEIGDHFVHYNPDSRPKSKSFEDLLSERSRFHSFLTNTTFCHNTCKTVHLYPISCLTQPHDYTCTGTWIQISAVETTYPPK